MERRKFTREFKLEAVRLIKERGVSYAQASQDLRVREAGRYGLYDLDRLERMILRRVTREYFLLDGESDDD